MKKNLFLTTVLLAGFVAPAFADDATTPDKKITGGAGTCTVDVLGVSADGATANTIATWTLNSYECAAGRYLDETTLNCTECPVGSYCPGGTFTVEANNSKAACPADYTSDAAATAESECYMGCELACGTNAECPENATCTYNTTLMVSGKQYVGSSCNTYPSFCPITSMECKEGYTNKIAKYTVEDLAKRRKSMSFSGYFQYCSANGTITNEYGHEHCNEMGPGFVLFDNLDFTQEEFEITFNDYGPDTPGLQKFEYTIGANAYSASYLNNADFKHSTDGKYVWIRSIKQTFVPDYVMNTPIISFLQNYGVEESCRIFALRNDLMQIPGADTGLSDLGDLIKSGDIKSEADLTNLIETEFKPLLSPEEIAILESIPISDIYLVAKFTTIVNELEPDPWLGDGLGLLTSMCGAESLPSIEEVQALKQLYFVLGGEDGVLSYNTPWVLPDQSLMQDLFFSAAVDLSEEQLGKIRDALSVASNAAFAAMESNGGLSATYCMPNQINISWNPNNGTDNVQGMCYYGSDIFLPLQDPVKPGYTFMGWKLVE